MVTEWRLYVHESLIAAGFVARERERETVGVEIHFQLQLNV